MINRVLVWMLLAILPATLWAQAERKYIREGNELYQNGKYAEAAAKYAEALKIKKDYLAAYLNQGNALYQQDSLDLAAQQFELAANLSTDKDLKAKAYHNLGNTYLKSGKYEESIEAYKNALRNNPNDADTRYNLAYAQSKLKTSRPKTKKRNNRSKTKKKIKTRTRKAAKTKTLRKTTNKRTTTAKRMKTKKTLKMVKRATRMMPKNQKTSKMRKTCNLNPAI